MRITNRMRSLQVLNNINTVFNDLNKYHTQVSTGKAFQNPSDDPVHAIRSMNVTNELQKTEQYASNIKSAQSIFTEIESSLSAISDSLTAVKDSLLKGSSTSYNDSDRVNIAQTVNSMKDNIINQLNKDFAGKYLFGGYNTSAPPFTVQDGVTYYNNVPLKDISEGSQPSYNDLMAENIYIQTGKATKINTSMPGIAVTGIGEDNMINVLEEVSNALTTTPVPDEQLEALMAQVDEYFENIQTQISTVGTQAKNLEVMAAQNADLNLNYTDLLSQIEDVDIETAVINYKVSEMAYQSALSVGSKIIQPTLLDFLK